VDAAHDVGADQATGGVGDDADDAVDQFHDDVPFNPVM